MSTVSMNFFWHVCQNAFESPEESFEGIHKFWGNMLSLSFFADFEWTYWQFPWKVGMILTNLSYVSRDNFWGKLVFLFLFSLVSSDVQRICLDFWKKYINGWKHFLPRVARTFGEKIFHQNSFSKKFFGLWVKFPDLWRTFDRQGLQNSISSARGSLWCGTIFSKWMRWL